MYCSRALDIGNVEIQPFSVFCLQVVSPNFVLNNYALRCQHNCLNLRPHAENRAFIVIRTITHIYLFFLQDSVEFESTLDKLEQDLCKQEAEIAQLTRLNEEAIALRDSTRLSLSKQVIDEALQVIGK